MNNTRVDKEEVYKLMVDLYKRYKPEQIAVHVDKSVQTIYAWHNGTRVPKIGDYEHLKTLLLRS